MLNRSYKFAALVMMSTAMAGLASAGHGQKMPELLPPNPEAGECYARVEIPAQYRSDKTRVLVEEARAELQVTEPQLRSRQEQVLVKEASVRYNVRQPTYRSVTDQVMVRPSYERLSVTRPQFKTVTETLNVSKPRLVWKKGNPATLRSQGYIIHSTADAGRGGRGYRSTSEYGRTRSEATLCGASCEIWCLVEAPGQSASYNRKIMTAPAEVQRVVVPAKYSTITKQVVADPGGVQEVPIPAEYRPITVEEVVRPASVHKVKVPPKYSEVDKKTLVSAERYEWRRVVCAPGTRPPAARRSPISQPVRSYAAPAPRAHYSQGASSGHTNSAGHQSRVYGQDSSYSSRTYSSGSSHAAPRTYEGARSAGSTHRASDMGLRGPQPTVTTSGPRYYGSDLPTYSEDYTKPAIRKQRRW